MVREFHTEHLNTPRLVADAAGAAVWRWDQVEPFGVNVPDENPSGLGAFEMPLRFPGQYADKETGLHYNYFRDYDASLGRYVESDPIGLRGGINTYADVASEPLLGLDPLGLAKVCCRFLNSAFGMVKQAGVNLNFGLGYRHCYVIADDGNRYSLFPGSIGGIRVGVPNPNTFVDPADPAPGVAECFDCPAPDCAPDQNACLSRASRNYPIGAYKDLGPNSNTFAASLARQCCSGGLPSGVRHAPGIDNSPPSAISKR